MAAAAIKKNWHAGGHFFLIFFLNFIYFYIGVVSSSLEGVTFFN